MVGFEGVRRFGIRGCRLLFRFDGGACFEHWCGLLAFCCNIRHEDRGWQNGREGSGVAGFEWVRVGRGDCCWLFHFHQRPWRKLRCDLF